MKPQLAERIDAPTDGVAREDMSWSDVRHKGSLVAALRLRGTTSRVGCPDDEAGSLRLHYPCLRELLEQLSLRSFTQTGNLLISVLVQYINANDAGPGFYRLAQRKGLLRLRASRDEKLNFWVSHVRAVHAHQW